MYKYTDVGLFFVHINDIAYLNEYLEINNSHSKIFSNIRSKNGTTFSSEVDCKSPILLSLDDRISFFGVVKECNPIGGGSPPSNPIPPSNGGSDPINDFINSLETKHL